MYTHINSPDTRTRANIQYVPWLLDGRKVELAVEGQTQDVVLKI
jgi:hypothetical protein